MSDSVKQEATKARRLTAEAFAELIVAPAYQHVKLIHKQKYPSQAPAQYQVPFYSTALSAIRKYYQSKNDIKILTDAIIRLQQQKESSRTKSNIRVLEAFRDGAFSGREIALHRAPRRRVRIGAVEVRFEPNLYGQDGDRQRFLVVNPRRQDADDDIARMTLELGYYVLSRNGVNCSISDFEYINLISGKALKISRLRKRTITNAEATALMVEAVWDSV